MSRTARIQAVGLMMVLAVIACGGSVDDTSVRRELVVSAAASLTEAFREIETEYESANPDVDVILNLGGSSLLREQILSGAPVGVFASASLRIMDQISDAGHLDGQSRVFARNRMAIAVPAGNPAGVLGLDDLGDEGLLVGLCAPTVPCGDLAGRVLAAAGIRPAVDTEEPNVRSPSDQGGGRGTRRCPRVRNRSAGLGRRGGDIARRAFTTWLPNTPSAW